MTILHGSLFFIATYVQVFLLGLQSRNVNSGQYIAAAITSWSIGAINIFSVKTIAICDPVLLFFIGSIAGPSGIVSAMLFHRHVFFKKN